MALLTDRIAKAGREFPRVYENRVVRGLAVASDALDSGHDLAVAVEGVRFQRCPGGVTEKAIGGDGPAQVRSGVVLVARSHVPDAPVGIVANRRLIKTLMELKGEMKEVRAI